MKMSDIMSSRVSIGFIRVSVTTWFLASSMLAGAAAATAEEGRTEDVQPRQTDGQVDGCARSQPSGSPNEALEGIQVETADIVKYERFFLQVLHAEEVMRIDHPQVDHIRGYCYRGLLMVVRQDLRAPRPSGWVQVNFAVADVGTIQREIEQAVRASELDALQESERAQVVRIRLKPDVPRTHCRAIRLEVGGPEGFMVGFDQFKEGSCKRENPDKQTESRQRAPHH